MFSVVVDCIMIILMVAAAVTMFRVSLGTMGTRKVIGLNNTDIAKHYFLLLLGQAEDKMVIYDDGDAVNDSYYWDDEVLGAIEKKLQEHPEFTMRCVFNCPVPDSLIGKFAEERRIDLRTAESGTSTPSDARIKVIDDGRMAYSTRFNPVFLDWQYELIDCLTVMRRSLRRVVKRELGASLALFEQKFGQASETQQ